MDVQGNVQIFWLFKNFIKQKRNQNLKLCDEGIQLSPNKWCLCNQTYITHKKLASITYGSYYKVEA